MDLLFGTRVPRYKGLAAYGHANRWTGRIRLLSSFSRDNPGQRETAGELKPAR
jgi:hypothetical protein